MPKKPEPTDAEILDVIIPVLVEHKKAGTTSLERTQPAVDAILKRWPGIGIKTAKARVTRLRNL